MARTIGEKDANVRILGAAESVEFFVEEGPFFYPLSCATAGWGSVIAGVDRARVLMLSVDHPSGNAAVLGEAEVRIDRSRPKYNAAVFADAKNALMEQGAHTRVRGPLRSAAVMQVPNPGIGTRVVQIARLVFDRVLKIYLPTQVQWTIGVLPSWDITLGGEFPWSSVKWLTPPQNGIIADPFLVENEGQTWLFYEQLMYDQILGSLWVAPLDTETGRLGDGVEVLKASFHLSFPNVFASGDDWYMLPEQARSGATSLYRARKFPYHWDKYRDLLPNFPGIDPVLHYRDGIWWLFATHGARPCNENNLHLFFAPDLEAEFVSHPMNPVAIGLHGARMAGRLIERGGKLFRLGQDGREEYGHALVMFEITSLTKEAYSENLVRTWSPEPQGRYPTGFHSYDECSGVAIIDGKRVIPRDRRSLKEILKLIINKIFHKPSRRQ